MDKWIKAREVATIAEVGESTARKIINQVNAEIKDKGGIVPIKGRAPRSIVLEKLGLRENG